MANVPRGAVNRGERSGPRARAIPALPQAGDVIAGKYQLVGLIGEGGMGVVFEANHLRLRQRVAIKILRPDVPDFVTVVARFEREARAAAQLQSIHAARVIDVDVLPTGLPYIVLEFLEGRDLDAELESTGPMPIEGAVDFVLQVAEAMSEAHGFGIVHRDLKPANLFVCRIGASARRVVKVLDFGISRSESDDTRLTPSQEYFGTPHYAAPEQLRAACSADARSDVWSLGTILFELLTGRTPFVGAPTAVIAKVVSEPVPWPTALRPDIPPELARVVMRALQRDPRERFQTMREFANALTSFAPNQSIADAVAEAPRSKGRLGEILVAEGMLTPSNLESALAEQRRSGKRLGRVLLDMQLLSQVDLLTALAKQQGVIVTPETANPIERGRRQRDAQTVPAAVALPVARAFRPKPWVTAIAIGLVLGIGGAAGLVSVRKSHMTAPAAISETSSASLGVTSAGLSDAPMAVARPPMTYVETASSDSRARPFPAPTHPPARRIEGKVESPGR